MMNPTTTIHTHKCGPKYVTRVTRTSNKSPQFFPENSRVFISREAEASYEKGRLWAQLKGKVRPPAFEKLDHSDTEWLWVQGQDKEEPLPAKTTPKQKPTTLTQFVKWLAHKL